MDGWFLLARIADRTWRARRRQERSDHDRAVRRLGINNATLAKVPKVEYWTNVVRSMVNLTFALMQIT